MADVQLENGYTKIANELLDAIQSFQFTQNQFKLLLALWRNTYGWNKKECDFSLNKIVSQTGLQKKRVIETLRSLEESNIILEVKAPVGSSGKIVKFNKNYDEWTIKKYKSMELSSGRSDTPEKELEVSKRHPYLGEMTPPSSGHADTSRVGHGDTPLNKKEILKEKRSKTAEIVADDFDNSTIEISSDQKPKIETPKYDEDYLRNLLNHFIKLRAHGFNFNPTDLSAAKEIQKAGVPIEVAMTALEEAFRNYNPRHSRDRIHSLSYCVGFILDQHFPPVAKSRKSTRKERLPDWFVNQQEQPTAPVPEFDEELEAKRKRLEAIQNQYKQGG